ncbi:MAG: phosphocholine cytidylyltransferase family protein [Ignavibacteria bacterium]|nr:phosphocholine cytidylyltransferase family protein [Ignavibacteria bacterium]
MQAVILAAGLAKRLRPLTDMTPKCLLDINGKNLLQMMVENLLKCDINDFIFVTGYRESMIKEYLDLNFKNINKIYISNQDYANNNNSYSLWMTKEFVKDDMLLLDSDILFDYRIVKKLLDSEHGTCIALKNHKLDEEQIKVIIDGNGKVLEIGKDVEISKSAGESIGIEKLSSDFLNEMFKILDRTILKENNVNEFYETTFQEIINMKDDKINMYGVDISDYECMEIDTIEDYEKAKLVVSC